MSVQQQVATRVNYIKSKQNKKRTRRDSVSSDEVGYTETDSEREFSEDKEDNYKQEDGSEFRENGHSRYPEESNLEEIQNRDIYSSKYGSTSNPNLD